MRPTRVFALVAGLSLLAAAAPAAATGQPPSVDVIVVLDAGTDARDAAADAARDHGFALHHVYEHALRGYAGSVSEGRLAALRRDPRVRSIERDQVVSLATADAAPTGVRRIFAPGNPNLTIDGTDDLRIDVDVAILDTGIDLDHPDLNVAASVSCFYSSGGPPHTRTYTCGAGGDDDHYHGTHVAGTVGALDDGVGVVGVAPGARLWAVKVLDSNGSGPMSVIVAGIDYVTANAGAIEVANMSLGCECTSSALDTALTNSVGAGVSYAVSAGNSGRDASAFSPANHPDVITVSALADFDGLAGGLGVPTCRTDVDDTLASFSNHGSLVEIAAPGVCIESTYPLEQGGYGTISGTSMASPHVAGAAAVLAGIGTMPPSDVRSTLVGAGNLDWTDDSGDGIHERLLDVSSTTLFAPQTVATTTDPQPDPGPDPEPSPIALSASGSKVKGVQHVELTWSGATTTDVDVYRDGGLVATTANDGSYAETLGKGGGSYTYVVCEAATTVCSNQATVTF